MAQDNTIDIKLRALEAARTEQALRMCAGLSTAEMRTMQTGALRQAIRALEQIVKECKPTRPDWHLDISSEGLNMARAALGKAVRHE